MSLSSYNDFLSDEDIEIIDHESKSIVRLNPDLISNLDLWDDNIVEFSKEVFICEFWHEDKDLGYLKSVDILHSALLKKFGALPYAYLFYFWTAGSYIPWHDDGHCKHAGTLYLNKEWSFRWGGLYQYEDNEGVKSITPEHNLLLIQGHGMLHSTTVSNKETPVRRTVQMFWNGDIK